MYKDMDWNLKKLGQLLSFNAMPAKKVNLQKSYYGLCSLDSKVYICCIWRWHIQSNC